MDNQHKLIKGYRDLTAAEIDLMNRIKALETIAMNLVWEVRSVLAAQTELAGREDGSEIAARLSQAEPNRWCAMAKSDLQVGFMQLVRAVAQPQSPNGNGQAS